jgi:ABC-2 type transport system ATP-binding protein
LAVALMSGGKIVFGGTPEELNARGEGHGVGRAPLERGCSAALSAARS